jgi:hypothetical protein
MTARGIVRNIINIILPMMSREKLGILSIYPLMTLREHQGILSILSAQEAKGRVRNIKILSPYGILLKREYTSRINCSLRKSKFKICFQRQLFLPQSHILTFLEFWEGISWLDYMYCC